MATVSSSPPRPWAQSARPSWGKVAAPGSAGTAQDTRKALEDERFRLAQSLSLRQDVETLFALAGVEYRLGCPDQAAEHLERCIEMDPGHDGYLVQLGIVLARLGRPIDAEKAFGTVAERSPDHVDALHNLGVLLRKRGQRDRALDAFRNVLKRDPHRTETLVSLAELLAEDGQIEASFRCFSAAIASAPADGAVLARFAQILADHGREEEAERHFRKALNLAPDDPDPAVGLGYLLEDRGDSNGAICAYRDALRRDPGQSFAIGRLLILLGKDADESVIRSAEWAMQADEVPSEARALIGYGLGRYRDAEGHADHAFAVFAAANAARRQMAGPLDREALCDRIDSLVSGRDASLLERLDEYAHADDDRIVFIVGMPRSGTTLTEQILASHPKISGAGELSGISHIASVVHDPQASTDDIAIAARAYTASVNAAARSGSVRVIDKAPLNFFHLDVIARLFPKARIIHCLRDPRDICLSIYFENFALSQTHATDLADLGFYWSCYHRLMMHWELASPLPVARVHYADLVRDHETISQALCAFLGVEWDDACLRFHQNDRTVRTPSRWQVRQPIYSHSLERWRRYQTHLGPLFAELEAGGWQPDREPA